MIASIRKLLLHPLFLLPVAAAAVYVGIAVPTLGNALAPIGSYYISLMKMIVLPYLFVTITLGIARVATHPKAREYTWRIVVTYPLTLTFVAVFGLGVALVLPPSGYDNSSSMAAMGNMVNGSLESAQASDQDSVSLGKSTVESHGQGLAIFDRFVPENIFEALSDGDALKVVIFCIIFGASMAKEIDKDTEDLFDMFKVVQSSCVQVIYWLTLLLPFALFSMVSAQVAAVGVGPILSLAPFVITQITGALCLIAVSVMIIAIRARVSPIQTALKLHDTFILALTTQSVVACIPTAIRDMTEKLGFSKAGTDLLLPLGTTICRVASTQYFVIGSIFAAQIYGIDMSLATYATIIIFSIAAGIASSGSSGAVTVVLISIVIDALHLPSEAIIPLFIAVDPIVTMFRVFVLVLGTCASTSIIIPRQSRLKKESDQSFPLGATQ